MKGSSEQLLGQETEKTTCSFPDAEFAKIRSGILAILFGVLYFCPESILTKVVLSMFACGEVTSIEREIQKLYTMQKEGEKISKSQWAESVANIISSLLGGTGATMVASGKSIINKILTAPMLFSGAIGIQYVKNQIKALKTSDPELAHKCDFDYHDASVEANRDAIINLTQEFAIVESYLLEGSPAPLLLAGIVTAAGTLYRKRRKPTQYEECSGGGSPAAHI